MPSRNLRKQFKTTWQPKNLEPDEPNIVKNEACSTKKKVPVIPHTTVPTATHPLHTYMDQVQALKRLLGEELIVCDAKFAMFFTAARTFDYEYNLQPHPPMYTSETTGLRIDMLIVAMQNVLPLKLIRQLIEDHNYAAMDTEVVELLYWLWVSMPQTPMRQLEETEFEAVVDELSLKVACAKPTHVFALGAKLTSAARTTQTCELATRYVFAAPDFGHVHFITHNGFKPNPVLGKKFAEISVFWELSDAIKNSHATPGWGASLCGSVIRCVMLCQLAMDPKFVETSGSGALVKQSDLLTPRYLLFYPQRREATPPPPAPVAPVRMKEPRYNILFSVLAFAFILGFMYLKEFYTNKQIWDGIIWGIQYPFE